MKQVTWVCLVALILVGCAAGGSQRVGESVGSSSFTRVDLPDGAGQRVAFRNRQPYTVNVISVTLTDCVNIRGGCGQVISVDREVTSQATFDILTVFAEDPTEPVSFRPRARTRRVVR